MSRTIKFRAWDKYRGENGIMLENHTFKTIAITNLYEANHLVWMQYTGLKDKNGKEIYEGDIVDFGNKNSVEVKFAHGSFTVFDEPIGWDFDSEDYPCKTDFKYCEVIGNIYENPELLEK